MQGFSSEQCNEQWEKTSGLYSHYPTVRHRHRWILNEVKRFIRESKNPAPKIFDYGCGTGECLKLLAEKLSLEPSVLAGCDLSTVALERARKNTGSPHFFSTDNLPQDLKVDLAICTEVIEHTPKYSEILETLFQCLRPGGRLLLTTQSGPLHACDTYTGHTQHFILKNLCEEMKGIGFRILKASHWGFPFYSLQKKLTDYNFESVKNGFLEGELSWKQKLTFESANLAFYTHQLIASGPQLFVVACK